MGRIIAGVVALSSGATLLAERLVEPRVQPTLMTVVAPVPVEVQFHCGRPPESNGAESTQTLMCAPGNWLSTLDNHSVICALAMAVVPVQGVVPLATFMQ